MRYRRVPLAWLNLTHNPRRLTAAVCGIGFAVVLIFMETGFENALFDSTVKLFRDLDADIIVASKAQYALLSNQTFSRRRIYQARACRGVKNVYPLYVELFRAVWKPPGSMGNPIRVLAFELGDPVFRNDDIARHTEALAQPGTAIVDTMCKVKHAIPASLEEILKQRGAELSDRSIRLVGTFEMGTDFVSDGNLIISAADFATYFPNRADGRDPLSIVDLGIVQVHDGADVRKVKRRLREMLPDDVEVYTKKGYINHEINFWQNSSPIGFVFSLGTMLGFVVGVIICYQTIYADIADHMAELATLKAMGYRNRYFLGFLLQQSVFLSALSFLPGLLVSLALYHALAQITGLLMILNFQRVTFVFLLTTAMCIVSGCLALQKVLAADPAELF